MADLKISQLTVATTPLAGTEVMPLVQGAGNVKATVSDVRNGLVASNTAGITGADAVTNMVSLTQAEYDAIGTKNASTVYVITS
jgi:hypothetical protein